MEHDCISHCWWWWYMGMGNTHFNMNIWKRPHAAGEARVDYVLCIFWIFHRNRRQARANGWMRSRFIRSQNRHFAQKWSELKTCKHDDGNSAYENFSEWFGVAHAFPRVHTARCMAGLCYVIIVAFTRTQRNSPACIADAMCCSSRSTRTWRSP